MPSDPLPPYPPERVWSFPLPAVRRRWFWVALIASIGSAALIVALIVAVVQVGSRDPQGIIDDTRVLDTIEIECREMTDAVESYPPARSARERAGVIRDQNDDVLAMVDGIATLPQQTLRDDDPTLAWLEDWQILVAARDDFADSVSAGTGAGFQVPLDADGDTIDRRMDDATLDQVCTVPDVLLDPDPRSSSTSI